MTQNHERTELREDLLRDLRVIARRGGRTREMVDLIHSRLGGKPYVVGVLAYMCRAFSIPLPEALPLRELVDTDEDTTTAMDELMLPAIDRHKMRWLTFDNDPVTAETELTA